MFRNTLTGQARHFSLATTIVIVLCFILMPPCSLAAGTGYTVTTAGLDYETGLTASGGAQVNDPGAAAGQPILQFTSAGHLLGFGTDCLIITSADHMLKTEFLDSNPVTPVASNSESGRALNGALPTLGRVTYRDLWEGVSLVYTSAADAIVKSAYYLEPVDGEIPVNSIRLGYNRQVTLDENGNLVVSYGNGGLMEAAPVAWQEIGGQKQPVDVSYVLFGDHTVGFSLDNCQSGIPVVIDPPMTWSPWNTFSGGGGDDHAYGITVDGAGNVYVVGDSNAAWQDGAVNPVRAFTANGTKYDAFVAQLNSDGSLLWHTFLGGAGDDHGYGVAVDGSGNVYINGFSNAAWQNGPTSPVLPFTSNGTNNDGFTAKLNNSGAIQWLTFLGGAGDDHGYGIALYSTNRVYVCGDSNVTWGSPPVRDHRDGPAYDAFAARLNSNTGALVWNTFLGGGGDDHCYGIAVYNDSGTIYVYVGGDSRNSWNPGVQTRAHSAQDDAFAARLNANNGNLQYLAFLGGDGDDYGSGIAVDATGSVYFGGFSDASWQVVPAGAGDPVRAFTSSGDNNDSFVARLTGNLTLEWHTFLGDAGNDYGGGIAANISGVYFGGYSNAAWGSPVRSFTANGTHNDGFAVSLNGTTGAIQWNTFLGGWGDDRGGGIAGGGSGVYFGGYSNASWGSPVRAFTSNGTNNDGLAVRLNGNGYLAPSITSGILAADNSYIDVVFSEGVYCDGSTPLTTPLTAPLTADKLHLTFVQNGGTATSVVIASITKISGGALTGGETTIRVNLTITGTPSGVETIEIKPASGSSVYDQAGFPASETETTGPKNLKDQRADLVILKTEDADPARADGLLTYTITVTNLGPGTAYGVAVNETYPANFTYNTASPAPSIGNNLWSFPSLSANATQTIQITGSTPAVDTRLTNTASVTSSTVDPDLTNNAASQDTVIFVPRGVGGEVQQVNKNALIIPWLSLALILIAGIAALAARRGRQI